MLEATKKMAGKIPSTMRGVVATRFGQPSEVLEMRDDLQVPEPNVGKGEMLVRVLAMSLSPGDWRMLSGDTKFIKKPKAWPYVPGLDVCGVVEKVAPGQPFSVGDTIIGTWEVFGVGGMAEYAIVKVKQAAKKPEEMSPVDAAALANSASHALQVADAAKFTPGCRVLVLGGSGAVGSLVVQLAKHAGASFIATTSTNKDIMISLGADEVIDYTKEEWSSKSAFNLNKFDVVVDCAEGAAAWGKWEKVLKPRSLGGRWIAVVGGTWDIFLTRFTQFPSFLFQLFGRKLKASMTPWAPRYVLHLGYANGKSITKVLEAINNGKMRVVVDERGPFPFSAQGAIDAFTVLKDRKAVGKLVLQVAET